MSGSLISTEIAEPYAQALMSVAQSNNLTEQFGEQFRALETLLEVFVKFPRAGIASPKICYYPAKPGSEQDVIQYAGTTHVHPFTARNSTLGEQQTDNGQFKKLRKTAYAHGAAMMVPRKVINDVGMMSEDFFLYYEELDWCEMMKFDSASNEPLEASSFRENIVFLGD